MRRETRKDKDKTYKKVGGQHGDEQQEKRTKQKKEKTGRKKREKILGRKKEGMEGGSLDSQ